MAVPVAMTGLLAIILACIFGAMVASPENNQGSATLCFIGCIVIYGISVIFTFGYGDIKEKEGMKEATIQCQTADCPYYLKTKDDSTRQWTRRKTVE